MELSIAAKLVDESNAGLANIRVYVYAYTADAKLTLLASGRTDPAGVVALNTSHALVQTVQPRMLLRYFDDKSRSYRYLTDQVETYSATKADFGTLMVKSTAALKVSATSFYAVNASLLNFSAAALDSEKTALRGQLDSLNSNITKLTTDKAGLQTQLSALSTEKTSLQNQLTTLSRSKRTLESNVSSLNQDKVALQGQVTTLGKDTERLQTQLTAVLSDRNGLQTQLGSLEQDVSSKASQIRSLNASLTRARSDKTTLATQLTQALADKATSLEQLRTQHEGVLSQKQQELERLGAQVEEYEKASGAETNLRDLVLNTASQLETARAGIKQQGKNYRLGNISMKLKVAPGPTGTGFSFLKKDEVNASNAGALSEISIEFPSEDETRAADMQQLPAPRLIGYTETVARRKLQPYGLNLDVAYQMVPDGEAGEGLVGRVIRQIPDAGSGELEAGSTITVFIGKAVAAAEA